jgi:hypothetical protein
LITRNLIVSLTIGLFAVPVAEVKAQSIFPAPLPSRVAANDPAFPPLPGQAGTRNDPAFPPLPGQAGTKNDPAFPPIPGHAAAKNDPAFPPVSGASFPSGGTAPIVGGGFASGPISPTMQGGGPSEACMKGFMTLRDEAQKRSLLIKGASERHATPDEACKLIENFSQAETKMMKYVEANSTKCGIPPYVL